MKNLLAFLFIILTVSCGNDKLSNSKAQQILEDCLEINPEQRYARLRVGKATFRDNDGDKALLGKYAQLVEDGFLEMELVRELKSRYDKGKEYDIKVTEKALEYLDKIPEKGGNVKTKAFKYIVDEVLEVQEIPSMNTAKVKVKYELADKTPFAIFLTNTPQDFWVDDLAMNKTSNGWKYCDNF